MARPHVRRTSGSDSDGGLRAFSRRGGPEGDPDSSSSQEGLQREGVPSAQSHKLPTGKTDARDSPFIPVILFLLTNSFAPTGGGSSTGPAAARSFISERGGGDRSADGTAAR